jgi:hypothetical protein
MAINEHSSAEMASLAGETLRDPNATLRERRLAGCVLTQARDLEVVRSILHASSGQGEHPHPRGNAMADFPDGGGGAHAYYNRLAGG